MNAPLDENTPHNEVDGGVLIVTEQLYPLLWVRVGGHANESVIETRVYRAALALCRMTMPTEAYAKMRALFVDPRACQLAYHALEQESGDVFAQLYALIRLDILRSVVGEAEVPEWPEEEAWRANPRTAPQVNTMVFLGTVIRLKHKRRFPGEFRAESHDHLRDILNGNAPSVIDQITG